MLRPFTSYSKVGIHLTLYYLETDTKNALANSFTALIFISNKLLSLTILSIDEIQFGKAFLPKA